MINVFNIEKFATHDGPGIRTTVFLKGCSLHCPWCANPESWSLKPTLMYDKRKCVGCRRCVVTCPQKAIRFDDVFIHDNRKCIQCGACVKGCFSQAIKLAGENMSIEAIVSEALKDKDYFDNSGGGVTISGGEPFLQFEGMIELIKELKRNQLHVAVETTGNYKLDDLKQALPYIDLFLFDVKHIDHQKLHDVTGGHPEMIFRNLEYLAQECPEKVRIRVPVIPEFNYSEETLEGIIKYARELGIKEVHLLPYHSLGKNKWEQIHKDYYFKNLKMMDKSVLERYVQYGKDQDVFVKIGG